jgi:hypothetical protein
MHVAVLSCQGAEKLRLYPVSMLVTKTVSITSRVLLETSFILAMRHVGQFERVLVVIHKMEEAGCGNGRRVDAFGVRGDRQETTSLKGYLQAKLT